MRVDLTHVFNPAPVTVPQVAPCVDERCAVGPHICEMPIEAALGDLEPFTEPFDPQRIWPVLGQECESGLNPVVRRQPAARTARRHHGRQHTAAFSRGN